MFRFRTHHLFLMVGLTASGYAAADTLCIATNGGFGSGGTTFVAPNITVPGANSCTAFAGWAKTASTVILATTGSVCNSSNGKVLTLFLSSLDPEFTGPNNPDIDYIRVCPLGTSGCSTSNGVGTDTGANLGGPAKTVACTTKVLSLPVIHD